MKITYSTAAGRTERQQSQAAPVNRRVTETVGLLVASLVTACALLLVYQAKTARLANAGAPRGRAAVNLNQVDSVPPLMPLLGEVGATETERRFIATRIVAYLSDSADGTGRRWLDSVSALGAITVADGDVVSNRRLAGLQQRVAERRARLGNPNARVNIPLLTATDLSRLGPAFIVRTVPAYRNQLLLAAALLFAGFYLAHLVLIARRSAADPLLVPIVHLLCGLGLVAMVTLRDPLRDALLFTRFAEGTLAGCVIMALFTLVDFQRTALRKLSYVPLAAAVIVSLLLVLFGSGPGASDAKVNLFGMQPVEAIRLLVVLFLAGYFANRWEFLRALREPATAGRVAVARWFEIPRLDYVLPVLVGMGLVLVFFFLQKDLGPALVLSCVFLALYGVARNRLPMVVVGLLILVGGFWVGYLLGVPHTVVQRFAMWRSPWENGLRGGDQVAQALWAMASGGVAGTGLGLGEPQVIPAGHTDLVLSVLGEELGFVGLAVVFGLFALLAARAFLIARRAPGDYTFFLALGLTLSLVLQLVLIAAGQTGVLPLTGVVTPFLSYGRSSMLANFAAIGMLLAIGERAAPRTRNRDFDAPLRTVAAASGVLLAIVVVRAAVAQVFRPEQTASAAALSTQADGVLRYQYNPRLVGASRQFVRGTIYDRNGVPLATSRADVVAAHRSELRRVGAPLDQACGPFPAAAEGASEDPAPGGTKAGGSGAAAGRAKPPGAETPAAGNAKPAATDLLSAGGQGPVRRCYPFGGITFHLLGDWRTRVNWGASNTSFEERDGDRQLRGYDDHAQVVDVRDPRSGALEKVVRRSYRELLPLWWYRYRSDHPVVERILSRQRDVHLTIDMRLEARVAAALAARIEAAGKARGAAVVLSDTGELLAAVSYPWPALSAEDGGPSRDSDVVKDDRDERLLDRARYGVYPPGSSFKLVTATAALRKDPAFEHTTFICERLPDGRVGQRIKGWGRPIRDDPTDRAPHGTLELPRALVVSCNAYFAQLGLKVGAAALAETAALFEIPLAQPETAAAIRDTLPFASYGQGQVLATPFKMARVAATMASGGLMPYGRWVVDETNARVEPPRAVLAGAQAQLLARAMRQVVLAGTGRALKNIEPPIAGKTGTAEVMDQASHSWFVGYAPYGRGAVGQHIAFAVIVENGGYGASIAAPIAGDIVNAARELGMVK